MAQRIGLRKGISFGFMLGQGLSVEDALKRLNQSVEGVHTVKAVYELSVSLNIPAPNSLAVYKIGVEGFPAGEVALELLKRPPQTPFEIL